MKSTSMKMDFVGIVKKMRKNQTLGAVVQLVRILACHASGCGFESRPLRHLKYYKL